MSASASNTTKTTNMLHIVLNYFKCWDNLSIDIPVGKITLIKGNSGVGKTTILQSIAWCLYGNVRKVSPNNLEKAKTSVYIKFPNVCIDDIVYTISINREKNPNRLRLNVGNIVLEDKEAQAKIDDMFGSWEIWLSSCYIGQNSRNYFLSAPNVGKMDLLNKIAFHEEEPDTFISRIDKEITDREAIYKIKTQQFHQMFNGLQEVMPKTNFEKAYSDEQVDSMRNTIQSLNEQSNNIKVIQQQREVHLALIKNIEQQLLAIKPTPSITHPQHLLDIIHKLNISCDVDALQCIAQKLVELKPLIAYRDKLNIQWNSVNNEYQKYVNIPCSDIYTSQDYEHAVKIETIYDNQLMMAKSCNVNYDQHSIASAIQYYTNILEIQKKLKIKLHLDKLLNNVETYASQRQTKYDILNGMVNIEEPVASNINPPDINNYEHTLQKLTNALNEHLVEQGSIRGHIEHLKARQDILQCPSCKTSIRFQKNSLVLSDEHQTSEDEIHAALQRKELLENTINNIKLEIQQVKNTQIKDQQRYQQQLKQDEQRMNDIKKRIQTQLLEKQKINHEIDTYGSFITELEQQIEQVKSSLDELNIDISNSTLLSDTDIRQIYDRIAKLGNIQIVDRSPVKSQYIQDVLSKQRIEEQVETIKSMMLENTNAIAAVEINASYINEINMATIGQHISLISAAVHKMQNYLQDSKREKSIRLELEQQIVDINNNLQPDQSQLLMDMLRQIELYTAEINASVFTHQVINLHKRVSQERDLLIEDNAHVCNLQTLKQHALDTECKILEQIVANINHSIEYICSSLFDKDINILLNLYKTLKSTKNTKPIANFTISYQGGSYDNINEMSGGEGDRVSLALTLALNRLSSCPILMLDESLASLDLNMKEASIRTIREHTNNTALVILHDGIEGIFDHVIDVDTFYK